MKVPTSVVSAVGAVIDGSTAHSREGPTLDFKQADKDLRKLLADVADAAMCFANASGGHVVVGVANRPGGRAALRGSGRPGEDLRTTARQRCRLRTWAAVPGLVRRQRPEQGP